MLELAFPDGSCKFFKEISFQHVFLLTMPYGMWHLSSSTRDHTHNLCIGNGESLPLGCQGNPLFFFFFFFLILFYIGVYLIYNVVLVSGIKQSGSVIHIHVSILFQILIWVLRRGLITRETRKFHLEPQKK